MLTANHQTLRRLPLRTFHFHEIDPSLSTFLCFWTIIAIKWYGMKPNTFLYVSCVAASPYNTPGWYFCKLHLQSSPQNKLMHEMQNPCVPDFTSHPASAHAPLTLGYKPRWRHFDVLLRAIENRGFNQSKNFCSKLFQKVSFIISVKNIFGVRCTLNTGVH